MRMLQIKHLVNFNTSLSNKLFSTVVNKNAYSSTVLLPSTKMPLRLENEKLIQRDTEINKIHANLYKWQEDNLKEEDMNNTFILHDGPPYANGAPHMGHAINKILKDTILRTKLLQGKRVHYVPGWDCHGLPIELKAVKQSESVTPLEIRQKARNFATETIERQQTAFQSWGVIGDWEKPYKTFDKLYIKNQLQQFFYLYEKKLIYRDVKPVYWSPSSKTALAEAELEYNSNHVSTAATVRFKLIKLPETLKKHCTGNIWALIWTTTPWTLPANQAICYNKDLNYSLIKEQNGEDANEAYLIASDLLANHSKLSGKEFQVLHSLPGEFLQNVTYNHPFNGEELKFLHSHHATGVKGTGLVHTAPAHGPDDFLVALQHNIKTKCLVDENGTYIKEAGPELAGLPVLDLGNKKVLQMLGNHIVHKEDFIHSYPYDWRTKKPVILRASQQWFIDMEPIKQTAVDLIADIEIIPKQNGDKYRKNLIDQIKKRPYWCISRQRCWGVPIPVFYDQTDQPVLNKEITNHLCEVLERTDADFWWKLPVEELLPHNLTKENKTLKKGQDILDIWFDSGLSWSSVLPKPSQQADMYLEGVDQFTGWFQSSLITSVALRNAAPYKAIYVHGFALDEKGIKMSKSLGNVIDPQEIMSGSDKTKQKKSQKKKAYGVDTLRWWVACHANQDATAHVSENVLKASSDEVQKIRSTLRYAVGSISDFNMSTLTNTESELTLTLIDRYMLHLLYTYEQQAKKHLDEYQFNKLCKLIINFATNEISALYYMAIKDRLYCELPRSRTRQAAQYTLWHLTHLLTQSIAPIVPHLAEEIFLHLPNKKGEQTFFARKEFVEAEKHWKHEEIFGVMQMLLDIKKEINKMADNASQALESTVEIILCQEDLNAVNENIHSVNELCDLFQVAEVKLIPGEIQQGGNNFKINRKKCEMFKCPRCRRISAIMPETLCDRCYFVVDSLSLSPTEQINA